MTCLAFPRLVTLYHLQAFALVWTRALVSAVPLGSERAATGSRLPSLAAPGLLRAPRTPTYALNTIASKRAVAARVRIRNRRGSHLCGTCGIVPAAFDHEGGLGPRRQLGKGRKKPRHAPGQSARRRKALSSEVAEFCRCNGVRASVALL